MAAVNVNLQINGFKPIIRLGGQPFSVRQYAKPASDTHAIPNFEVVWKAASSVPVPESPAFSLPGIQSAVTGTPGATLWLGASLNYGAASADSVHSVSDEMDCVFFARPGGTTPQVSTALSVGKNANINVTAPAGQRSRSTVNQATIAATAGLDCRIRAISMILPNQEETITGSTVPSPAILEVTFNKHFFAQGTAGV
jgi:hypothetical protein